MYFTISSGLFRTDTIFIHFFWLKTWFLICSLERNWEVCSSTWKGAQNGRQFDSPLAATITCTGDILMSWPYGRNPWRLVYWSIFWSCHKGDGRWLMNISLSIISRYDVIWNDMKIHDLHLGKWHPQLRCVATWFVQLDVLYWVRMGTIVSRCRESIGFERRSWVFQDPNALMAGLWWKWQLPAIFRSSREEGLFFVGIRIWEIIWPAMC